MSGKRFFVGLGNVVLWGSLAFVLWSMAGSHMPRPGEPVELGPVTDRVVISGGIVQTGECGTWETPCGFGTEGEVILPRASGTDEVTLTLTFPKGEPKSGQVLTCDKHGICSWTWPEVQESVWLDPLACPFEGCVTVQAGAYTYNLPASELPAGEGFLKCPKPLGSVITCRWEGEK